MKLAILCEKKSAYDNFVKAFGGSSGVYDGHEFRLVHARGHLYEFVLPDKQVGSDLSAQYKSWNLEYLPWTYSDLYWKKAPKADVQVKNTLIPNIKAAFLWCDGIVIGTDVDPSGEGFVLAWEIIEALKMTKKRIYRMIFVDERPESLQKAFKSMVHLETPYKYAEYLKGDTRSRLDYLSMQHSRLVTKIGDATFETKKGYVDYVGRVGRLKSFIIDSVGRQIELYENYKKQPFYSARFVDTNGNIFKRTDEKVYGTKDLVILPNFKESDVEVLGKELKHKAPEKLLDLSSLAGFLKGHSGEEIINAVQTLYEHNILSYPRTEDKTITTGQFNEMLPLVDKIADCVGVNKRLLTHRSPRKTHVVDTGAHGANRPGTRVPESLLWIEKNYSKFHAEIYELLAKSFLAMFAPDCQYEVVTARLVSDHSFESKIRIITDLGYRKVFETEPIEAQEVSFGASAKLFIHEGFPKREPYPNVKWLMKELDKHGVGTGATRLSTYSEMLNKKAHPSLLLEKDKITLSSLGWYSYYLCKGTKIASVDFTKNVQDDLVKISLGKFDKTTYLENFAEIVNYDKAVILANKVSARKSLLDRGYVIIDKSKKTKDGSKMADFKQKEKATITFTDGTERTFNREFSGYRFTDEEVDALSRGETISITFYSAKSKQDKRVKGVLREYEFNGKACFGFQVTEWLND